MRANKEARKREMEEMERMKAQLLEEEASILSGGKYLWGRKEFKSQKKVVGGGSKYFYLGESNCGGEKYSKVIKRGWRRNKVFLSWGKYL